MNKRLKNLVGFFDLSSHEYLHPWSRWTIVGSYMLFIYISLPITPVALEMAISRIGRQNMKVLISIGLLAAVITMVYIMLMGIPKSKWWWTVLPFLGVVGLASSMGTFVERIHFLEYAILAYLMYWAAGWPRGKWVVVVSVAAMMVGLLDECIQWTLPNRHFDLWDVIMNAIGATLGLWFGVMIRQSGRAGDDRVTLQGQGQQK
ncbi:MAG: VanZ family protein [Magnetococcus sp. YQC-5]